MNCSEAPALVSEGSIYSREAKAEARQFTEMSCPAFSRSQNCDIHVTSASVDAPEHRGLGTTLAEAKRSPKHYAEGVRSLDLEKGGE